MTIEILTAASRAPLKSRNPSARLEAVIPPGILRFRADDRDRWLAMRRQDVTASVIAALVGEHPYQTRLGLYALKTGQLADAEVEPALTETSISLPPMMRGTVLEPIVPVLVGTLRPSWKIEPCGWYYRDPTARIGATPDFIAIDPARPGVGSIQAKTTDQSTFRRVWRGEDGVVTPPMFIVIQAIVEAVLTGASWAEVAVMVSGSTLDLHLIPIPIHAGIMTRLRAEVAEFWRSVEAGEAPEADYGRDAEVLAALYRDDNAQELDLTSDNRLPELLAERDALKDEIKVRTTRVDEIDTEFRARLGFYERALLAGRRRVTLCKEVRRARFAPQSESRVLRFSRSQRS